MGNFNQEDLIRYLYNEMSDRKSSELKSALQVDQHLREEYSLLLLAKQELEAVKFTPAPDTVSRIMDYATRQRKND